MSIIKNLTHLGSLLRYASVRGFQIIDNHKPSDKIYIEALRLDRPEQALFLGIVHWHPVFV